MRRHRAALKRTRIQRSKACLISRELLMTIAPGHERTRLIFIRPRVAGCAIRFRRNDSPQYARRHGYYVDSYWTECCSTRPESTLNRHFFKLGRCNVSRHRPLQRLLCFVVLKSDDRTNTLARVHQVQGVIDFLDWHRMCHHLVNLQCSLEVVIDKAG